MWHAKIMSNWIGVIERHFTLDQKTQTCTCKLDSTCLYAIEFVNLDYDYIIFLNYSCFFMDGRATNILENIKLTTLDEYV